jgi:glycosyltransferase involved in cell wall biosynthesis
MKGLRALHVIPSVSERHGGPSYAVRAMGRALIKRGVDVLIATTDADGNGSRLNVALGSPVERGGVNYILFGRDLDPYKISMGLWRWLNANIRNFDLVHIHALFSFSSTVAGRTARKHAVPYIVRPLGVLNRWGMENRRRLVKALSFRLIENPILKNAAAIHYTSRAEQREAALCDPLIAAHRSAVIPLPVIAPRYVSPDKFLSRFPAATGKQLILYLSRIHPKKGVELLLEAVNRIASTQPSVLLVLAGEGPAEYLSILRRKVAELKLDERVIWPGFLTGDDKAAAFAAATIFVLPSFSENFGIAAAESVASGVPTVITEHVAIAEYLQQPQGALIVEASVEALSRGLAELLTSPEKRRLIAANGQRIAASCFSLGAVGSAIIELYEEVLGHSRRVATGVGSPCPR